MLTIGKVRRKKVVGSQLISDKTKLSHLDVPIDRIKEMKLKLVLPFSPTLALSQDQYNIRQEL